MIDVFAVTNRGLEPVSAREMKRLPGIQGVTETYRRIQGAFSGELRDLLKLRTVDDIFINLGSWPAIPAQRLALLELAQRAGKLKLEPALEAISQVRELSPNPIFSVTANFVGKRNYSGDEIKQAVAQGIGQRYGWTYAHEDQSTINVRIFLDHDQAQVGIRLGERALHRRGYKQANLPGSLKPTIAAAMLQVADLLPGDILLDPCCGAGTILIEGALAGAFASGGDLDPLALAATQENAASAGVDVPVESWDVCHLPIIDHEIKLVVTNLPWGRQVEVDRDLAAFYRQACGEISRVLTSNGSAVILTSHPDWLEFPGRKRAEQFEISLFGQTPTISRFVI